MSKDYKIVDCEKNYLEDFIKSYIELGWTLHQLFYIGEYTFPASLGGLNCKMFTVVYEREAK